MGGQKNLQRGTHLFLVQRGGSYQQLVKGIACSIVLAATFAWAATAKLQDTGTVAQDLLLTLRLPLVFGVAVGHGLVLVEWAVVLGLLASIARPSGWAFYAAGALLAIFSAYLIFRFAVGNELPCACGLPGGGSNGSLIWSLSRNFGFIGISLIGLDRVRSRAWDVSATE